MERVCYAEIACTWSLLEVKKVLRASKLFLLLLTRISMVVFGEKSSCISMCTLCGKKTGQIRTLWCIDLTYLLWQCRQKGFGFSDHWKRECFLQRIEAWGKFSDLQAWVSPSVSERKDWSDFQFRKRSLIQWGWASESHLCWVIEFIEVFLLCLRSSVRGF